MEGEERNYEEEAGKEGWAPKEDWKGPEDKWKTAQQFVEDGEKIVPILKNKVDRLESRVHEVLESNKQFAEFSKKSLAKEKQEKQKLIKELETIKAQAITDGDGIKAVKADQDIRELQIVEPEQPQSNPLADEWLRDNPWYNTNDKLGAFADGIAERIVKRGFTGKAYFDELTRQVKETFPDEFGNKNRKKPATVDSGEPVVSGGKTFNDLPKEAKDMFKQFKQDIPGFTKEQYLEQYDWTSE